MFRRFRRIKIVITLGLVIDRDNNFEKVIAAGVNVVRMNFFYGSFEDYKMRADKVREIVVKLGRYVVILGDFQGFKIRVFIFKEGKVFFNIGDKFLFDVNLGKGEGDKEKVGIDYKGLFVDVVFGDILLLDDGRVQLKVLEVQGMKVFIEVIVGGFFFNNKGINKFGGGLSVEALIEKDKVDIKIAALIGVDYLVVFFLRCGEDLNYVRRLVRDVGCDAKIVVKVERAEVVCSQDVMDDIIFVFDVVMVVRGDFGVEIGDSELVGIQKALIRRARQLNRAVITAIQMMELMIINSMSTRVEVMDVVNVVLDGIDVVMLFVEIVVGQYSLEIVVVMARVCLGAEKISSINVFKYRLDVQFDNVEEVIVMLVMYVVNYLKGVTAIIIMIESGRIALMIFRISFGLLIFVMSRYERTLNLIVFYRGVTSVYFDSVNDGVVVVSEAVNLLRDKGYLMFGDLVIVIQGDVMSIVGFINITRILTVE